MNIEKKSTGFAGRPCKIGGSCVAGATSGCACSELVDTDSSDTVGPAEDNDFPLGPACDLSGEGHCTACE